VTREEAEAAMDAMQPNEPEAAAALYREAIRSGVAWPSLAIRLLRLQDDMDPLNALLLAVDREFAAAR
jgi:hypothetical protein